jgi:hypothetical protein
MRSKETGIISSLILIDRSSLYLLYTGLAKEFPQIFNVITDLPPFVDQRPWGRANRL